MKNVQILLTDCLVFACPATGGGRPLGPFSGTPYSLNCFDDLITGSPCNSKVGLERRAFIYTHAIQLLNEADLGNKVLYNNYKCCH